MPEPQGRWATAIGCLLLLAGLAAVVTGAISQAWGWIVAGLASLVVGLVLMRLDPGALPKGCETLGDLATKVSARNFGTFARSGGAVRSDGLWDALTEVL